MKTWERVFCAALVGGLLSGGVACKLDEDEAAAARQLKATSQQMQAYYSILGTTLDETVALDELDTALRGVPFDAEARAEIVQSRAAILMRQDLLRALEQLSQALEALTASTARSDVQTAATNLGEELIQVKALPAGSAVPDAVGQAGRLLLTLVQQHQEKKAAQAIDSVLAALLKLFESERPAYDSIARVRIEQAAVDTDRLVTMQATDATTLLRPALSPFGLSALPANTALRDVLHDLAKSRLKATTERISGEQEAASTAMQAALQEMSNRVHALATSRRMSARGDPPTLAAVQVWADSAR